MKYLVASDLHGSLEFTKRLLSRFEIEKADKLILLGDIYYHGPRNPLPAGYSPMEIAALLNALNDSLVVVRGNCDSEVDQMISQFRFRPSYSIKTRISGGKCADYGGNNSDNNCAKNNGNNREGCCGDYVVNDIDKTIIFTHGHKFNLKNPPQKDFDVLVYGHEHTGYIRHDGNKLYVNAGSVSLPKNGTPHSYLIIEDGKIILKNLEGAVLDEACLIYG